MDRTSIEIVVGILLVVASFLSGMYAEYWFLRLQQLLLAHFDKEVKQAVKISELEAALERQRHTENTNSGIDDAGLILTSQLYRAQMVKGEIETIIEMLSKSTGILGQVGQGPRSYPVDPPSGERQSSK